MSSKNTSFPQILVELTNTLGEEVLLEQRLMGLVQDLTSGHFALSPVLRNAIQSGVPQRLQELMDYDEEERDMHIDNITLAFQDNYMLRPQAASYIVSSFAYAMGLEEEEPPEFDLRDESGGGGGPIGEPSYVQEDDGEYCGYHRDDKRSGFGILKRDDGSSFYGEWRVGMRMGFGLAFTAQQEKYAGQWYMNRQNGIGVMLDNNGRRYLGTWKQGRRDGWGMELLPSGNTVCSHFQKGKPSNIGNKGACLLTNGDIIVGPMGPNGPDGKCLHISQQREPWEEEWKDGMRL